MTDKAPGGEPVKRYEYDKYDGIIYEDCDGGFVKWDDYDLLRAQLAAAEKERDDLIHDVSRQQEAVNESEQRATLAESALRDARNAALEEAAKLCEGRRTHHPHRDNNIQDAVLTVTAERIRNLKSPDPKERA